MGLAYVFSPLKQWQDIRGVNAVDGWLEVLLDNTDDHAVTYKDFGGTLNEEKIRIDNCGRAVVIADAEKTYRLEFYDKSGALRFTQYPVWPLSTGGGGMDAISLESTDGSISVQKTSAGGVVSYDLAVNRTDDPEFLEWVKCSGSSYTDGVYVPHYSSGTMEVGSRGLNLTAGMYYHVTAVIQANKSGVTPYYDNVLTTFSLFDGENTTQVESFTNILDHSLGLSQNYSVSLDVEVGEHDSQLVITIGGALEGTTFSIVSLDVHRIYSGVPKIPDGVARKSWVEQNYQEKLTAGQNITINPDTNTISATVPEQAQADWMESDTSSPSYINHKPDLSVYARGADLSTVAFTGNYSDLSNKPDLSVYAVRTDLASVAFSADYAELNYAPEFQTTELPSHTPNPELFVFRIAPTGGEHLPIYAERASHDQNGVEFTTGYALKSELPTIDQHYNASSTNAQSGVAVAEALSNVPSSSYSAGGGIDINNSSRIISAKADGTSITYNANGELEAHNTLTGGGGIDINAYNVISAKADGTSITYNSDGELEAHNTLIAGGGIDIYNNIISAKADGTTITYNANGELQATVSGGVTDVTVDGTSVVNGQGVAEITMPTFTQVNSDWNASSGVSAILNKPTLATVATTGAYSDLSGTPTIPAAQVQSDWSQSDNTQVDFIKNKPSLATVATSGSYSDLTNTPSIPTIGTITL